MQLFKRVRQYVHWDDTKAALMKLDQFNAVDFANGWKVDLIVRNARDCSLAEFDRREPAELDGLQ